MPPFSTNMAVSETKGQERRAVPTQCDGRPAIY